MPIIHRRPYQIDRSRTPVCSTIRPLSSPGILRICCHRHPWVVRIHAAFHSMYSNELAAVNTVIAIMKEMTEDGHTIRQPHPLLSWAHETPNHDGGFDELCTATVVLNRGDNWLPDPYRRSAELEDTQALSVEGQVSASDRAAEAAGIYLRKRLPNATPNGHKDVNVS